MSISFEKIPVFITHAWRFHNDWNQLTTMMESMSNTPWINYSIPWYDPAINVHSERGKETLRHLIYTQILPVNVVIFLEGPYESKSSRVWFDLELELAQELNKKIIVLPNMDTNEFMSDSKIKNADYLQWDMEALIKSAKQ